MNALTSLVNRVTTPLLALRAFVTLVRDPNELGMVFELRERLADPARQAQIVSHLKQTKQGRDAFSARPRVAPLDLAAFARMPTGSVGRAVADYFARTGLDPAAIPQLDATDDASYFEAHLYETHDLWHVLTGFGTDQAGELGLQAFYLAQFPAHLSTAILAAGHLNTMLSRMDDRLRRGDEIARGWLMGRRARPLFGLRWADWWHRPLAELRADMGIDGVVRECHELAPLDDVSAQREPRRGDAMASLPDNHGQTRSNVCSSSSGSTSRPVIGSLDSVATTLPSSLSGSTGASSNVSVNPLGNELCTRTLSFLPSNVERVTVQTTPSPPSEKRAVTPAPAGSTVRSPRGFVHSPTTG